MLFGKNIVSADDPLVKVPVVNIWHALRNPRPETVSLIRQLRVIRTIDPKRYGVLKRQLPYFVCSVFNPPFRRGENFAYTEHLMLDFDKLTEKQLSVDVLKQQLMKDDRVMLCFVSPSEDGLKALFKLYQHIIL